MMRLLENLRLQPAWLLTMEFVYVLLIIAICVRVIWDTRSVSKTLAYLLLVVFLPIVGSVVYFSVGINYRKRKIYSKKLVVDDVTQALLDHKISQHTQHVAEVNDAVIQANLGLITLLSNPKSGHYSPISITNEVTILSNGEALFPELKQAMLQAKHHLHLEYYIYNDDVIGNELADIMIQKAQEGVAVRFIYDDFGSKDIRGKWINRLKAAGVEAYPFNKIYLIALANRLNYRNHRKIVVIDGTVSFVGGINVSDKYINEGKNELYWRDTHLKLKGNATHGLQHIFISDWNFCSDQNLTLDTNLFPIHTSNFEHINTAVQIVSSGPDSTIPAILNGILYAIDTAKKEVCLTTPYYIPDEQLQQCLILAALSGIQVHLLVPEEGDSSFVNIVAQSYYEDLLSVGVRIYKYTKGFVHAKTFVIDSCISSIGTANLDARSFDLNFEVTAFIYDEQQAGIMRQQFFEDLANARELVYEDWYHRPQWRKLLERILRLLSPLL